MATHHIRHSSHHSKRQLPAHARPSKPTSKRSQSHGIKSEPKFSHDHGVENEDEESMAVSFLNFCLSCEKQIITPSNSILYCSESCRRQDSEKSLTPSFDYYSTPTTPITQFSFDEMNFRDIVPQRSPTQTESKRSSCTFSDMSSDDNVCVHDEKTQRSESEASRYLRQFQSMSLSEQTTPRRPHYSRASTSQASISYTPSLSNTPASSMGYSLPYTPSTARPLPPRNNPQTSLVGARSIELVTPMTAMSIPRRYSYKTPPISSTSVSTIEGEINYAKSPVPHTSPVNGSLGRLLASTPRA